MSATYARQQMIRMMYILGVLVLILASGVCTFCVLYWCRLNPGAMELQDYRSAVQRFREGAASSAVLSVETLPLIVEAQAFERYLNPPKTAERLPRFARNDMASSAPAANPVPSAPVVRPAAPSVRFKLCATSYYPNEPGRSMALVSDVGSAEGDQRWVKEGAKLGHFVVHEIRRGVIVYRDGGQLREMAVERGTALPRLVRDPRPASPTARAATPADPDTIEIRGE